MRSRKAFYNILAMGVFEVVSLVCSLILPRLLISSFGSDYNGVISSVTQFLQLISILQAGVGGATRVVLYKALAAKDSAQINGILKANQQYMRRIAFAYLAYVLVMAAGYSFVAQTEVAWLEAATLIVIVGAGTFAQYFFGITYQTLLKADQRNYVYYIFQVAATIFNTIISVILINTGCSIQMVKLGSSVVFCFTPIALSLYVRRRYNIDLSCEPATEALKQKNNVMLHTIADIVYDNVALVALTFFCSTMLISVYAVYNLVLNGLRKAINVFTGGLEAGYGNMWAKGEMDTLRKRTMTFEFIVTALVSVVFSTAFYMLLPFIRLYTAGITDINYVRPSFSVLALMATVVYCLRMPYVTLVQACGKYQETRKGIILELFINVTLAMVLVQWFGLSGVSIALLSAGCIRLIYFMQYLYRNVLKVKITVFVERIVWTAGSMSIIHLLHRMLLDRIIQESWSMWIVTGFLAVGISIAVTAVSALIFYRSEVRNAGAVIKRMLGRNK